MGYAVEPEHEEQGKVRCRCRHESWCLVRSRTLL
jgi:hypothetical protein